MARYQAVRGTFDVLPSEMPLWHNLEGTSRDLAHRFGYREIRTPLFEEADLFTRGMGVMSGLIEKELWTFQDKFGQKLALRTDATTGVIRAYQQNKLYNAKLPLKVFYQGPVFLLGKEGEARSRQSHQFGFEAIGSSNPALDAEVIALAAAYCETLGLKDVSIRLNTLGGRDCRPLYLQKLKDYFSSNSAQLCPTCKRKYRANPDWVLSCTEESCTTLSQVAPTIFGMLTNEAKSNFAQLREYLKEMDLPVELDPRVVRDSEYYNGTIFEVRSENQSIGFGGRYDTLIEKLGGKSTPAVGFAFSLEAIHSLLKTESNETEIATDVLLRPEGPESARLLVPLLFTLRQRGVTAELDYGYDSGRKKREATQGYSYLVTLDESNAFRGTAILRDLDDNSEEKVPVARLRNRVLHVAGVSSEEERDGSKSGRKKLRRGRKRSDDDRSKTEDSKRKSEDDNSSEPRSSRRSRLKSRRNREAPEREAAPDKESANETAADAAASNSSAPRNSRSRRGSRDSGRDKESGRDKDSSRDRDSSKDRESNKERESSRRERRPRPSKKESEPELGKAIVPVLGIGGGSRPTPAKSVSKEKSAKKKTAVTAPPPSAASGGGLNWSIMPGKEGV